MKIWLLQHIRKIVLGISLLLLLAIPLLVFATYPSADLQKIRLTQIYAFTATIYIYLALLVSPLYSAFPSLPIRGIYTKARRALGVSGFVFAAMHAMIAFNFLIGGITRLPFLTPRYLLALVFSSVALLILALMAATSFDRAQRYLGKYWKMLHRFVYLASLLIVIHALMLGTHFITLSSLVPQVFIVALIFLLILESFRFNKYLSGKISLVPKNLLGIIFVLAAVLFLISNPKTNPLSSHGQNHVEENTHTMEENERYNVLLISAETIIPGVPTKLDLEIWDTNTRQKLTDFETVSEQKIHVLVVDTTLKHFQHLHPTITAEKITIDLTLPETGVYKAYATFQPFGAGEQIYNFNLYAGDVFDQARPDALLTKHQSKLGDLTVEINSPDELDRTNLSSGKQPLTFNLKDDSGNSIAELEPYLGNYGHLSMISHYNYGFVHIHPVEFQNSRSPVSFTIADRKELIAGKYTLFFEFKYQGKVYTADFIINLK